MKFSDLLGEPEPDPRSELPTQDAEPISVFAPDPESPPPVGTPSGTGPVEPRPRPATTPVSRWADNVVAPTGRSGLAELNVRQPGSSPPTTWDASVVDQLVGLTEIVDDLLPSARRGRK
jgi:hypothetical protein